MRNFVYSLMVIAAVACTAELSACNHSHQSNARWGISFSFNGPCRPTRSCYDDYCDDLGNCVEFTRSSSRPRIRGRLPRQEARAAVRTRRPAHRPVCSDHHCGQRCDSEVFYYRSGSYR